MARRSVLQKPKVWGLGLRVEGLGLWVEGLGLKVEGLGLRVSCLRFRSYGVLREVYSGYKGIIG